MNRSIPSQQARHILYRIRLAGHLDTRWSGWFDGFAIRHLDDGTTLLAGTVADQAALHGTLERIRDLGLTLLSIGSDGEARSVPTTGAE